MAYTAPLAGLKDLRVDTDVQDYNNSTRHDDHSTSQKACISPAAAFLYSNLGATTSADPQRQDANPSEETLVAAAPIGIPRREGNRQRQDENDEPLSYFSSTPIQANRRRSSVTFFPEVRSESGTFLTLQEPGSFKKKQRPSGRSVWDAMSTDTNKRTGSGESSPSTSDLQPLSPISPTNMPTGSLRMPQANRMYLSPTAAHFENELYAEQPVSLTSQSTAPSFPGEAQTPSDLESSMYANSSVASPLPTSPSIDPFGSWAPKSQGYGSFSKGSYRRSARKASRRSTASSAASPASAFLSAFTNVDEPGPEPDDEGQEVKGDGADYVIGKQIGFGGFSTVKEATRVTEDGTQTKMAVKIVRKQISSKDEKENEQFQTDYEDEWQLWRDLQHQHILHLDAVCVTDFATFCFSRIAHGGTVFDLMRSNRNGLPLNLAQRLTFQLASAIRYLHQDIRIVHRDIKLENCLLDTESRTGKIDPDTTNLLLCDFGMAKWMDSESTTVSHCNSTISLTSMAGTSSPLSPKPGPTSTGIAGSLEYASPELLNGHCPTTSPSPDIWAFGVCIYTLLVGDRPFQDTFAPRVHAAILKGEWDEEAIVRKGIERGQVEEARMALEVVRGCMCMDVNERWGIEEVLNSEWLGGLREEVDEEGYWR